MAAQSPQKLEERIGHLFKDPALLKTALTHASTGAKLNYERLEFLGDRVLGLVVAGLLYARFPNENEGDLALRLAALVQGRFLAEIAQVIDLGSYIELSAAEALAGGAMNENILADVFEALIGALYLDGGFEKCQKLIHALWADRLHIMITPPQHPKTRIQEWAQGAGLPLPVYKITGQSGPDHAPVFEVELSVQGHAPLLAQGRSRQVAEREAAALFLKYLEEEKSSK
ncbi:MAG: ribonuclease III [Alphaproteobacteria bacterium]|nr:ribonuclease III [Alphaproteobacteria bacterium]